MRNGMQNGAVVCQSAEWDAQWCTVHKNAKQSVQGCSNGRGSLIMRLVGAGMHGDTKWDLSVILGE